MTLLQNPVRRETQAMKRDAGRTRPLMIGLYPAHLEVRLKGTRRAMLVSYEAVYDLACKQAARAAREEKKGKR